jgi:histidinol dehydrogenase
MGILAVRRWADLDADERARLLARSTAAIFEPALQRSIETLFEDVRARGDAAVVDATLRFDGVRLAAADLRVRPEELAAAHAAINPPLLAGIREAIRNSRLFNEAQVRATAIGWLAEVRPGFEVGERVAAIPSAGLYVPAGKGSFPSVLVQVGVPALVAGVPEIAVLVPPMPGTGAVDPATLAVAHELGLANVFRANGPAGIAALTFGTATFPRVRKVVGPGSPAVTAAQVLAQRFGTATNMLCGPSESLLLADATADSWPDSAALVATDAPGLVASLEAAVAEQVAALPEPRRSYATAVLGNLGGALLFDTMAEAIAFANEYAPEHLQVATADPEATQGDLRYAGEMLLGQDTPIGASSYSIGLPATLPTGGFAKLNGGVTARTFQTTTSIARLTPEALAGLAGPTTALADHEGFPAHANAFRGRGLV